MDKCAGCRLVEERFNVKNTYTAGYNSQNIHAPATRYQVQLEVRNDVTRLSLETLCRYSTQHTGTQAHNATV